MDCIFYHTKHFSGSRISLFCSIVDALGVQPGQAQKHPCDKNYACFAASAASPAPTHPSTKESTTVGAAEGCFGSNAQEVAPPRSSLLRGSYLNMGNIAPTFWTCSNRRRHVFWFNNRRSCVITKQTHVLAPQEDMSAWSSRTHIFLCSGSARHCTNLE